MLEIHKLLDVQLPAKFAQYPDRARAIGAKFQITVTGPEGGDWNIDVSATGPKITKGPGPADVGITIADTDAQKLFKDSSLGMQFFMMGKLKVTGNQMLAMKLGDLLNLGA